jgi:hypothetical protein
MKARDDYRYTVSTTHGKTLESVCHERVYRCSSIHTGSNLYWNSVRYLSACPNHHTPPLCLDELPTHFVNFLKEIQHLSYSIPHHIWGYHVYWLCSIGIGPRSNAPSSLQPSLSPDRSRLRSGLLSDTHYLQRRLGSRELWHELGNHRHGPCRRSHCVGNCLFMGL